MRLANFGQRLPRRLAFRLLAFRLLALCLCLAAPLPAALAQGDRAVPATFWSALAKDEVDAVQTWLLRGVDTNATHPQQGPAIVVAAREGAWRSLRLLAGITGTRVDVPSPRGETALMLAAAHGHLDSVRLLVERGAEVNRPGWTPLHYAASSGDAATVRYLLEHHAYVDAQSPNRTTPLMMAARQKRPGIVRLLIEEGADPTARNEAGFDAVAYLERHGETEQAQWVRERAADYARRYGTLERPRSAEEARAERDRAAEDAEAQRQRAAEAAERDRRAAAARAENERRLREAESAQNERRRAAQAAEVERRKALGSRLPGMRD